MSDIEKVRAKSNHLPAPSLKGAALRSPGLGQGGLGDKGRGARGDWSSACGKGVREELEISRVNAQRDRKLGKTAHSAARCCDHGVEQW